MNTPLSITVEHRVPAAPRPCGDVAPPSPRVAAVAAMFGLGLDADRAVAVLPPTTLHLRPGRVIFVTGPSGGGKTTLLRRVAQALADRPGVTVLDLSHLPEPAEVPLVDAVDGGALPLGRALRLLSLAGLNDAFVMLRRPAELSDGQRHRFRLARAMARVEMTAAGGLVVVLADEFGATLDRTTAAVLARNVRRWVKGCCGDSGENSGDTRRFADSASAWGAFGGVCFVAATTHDDLLEPLEPDVLIEKHLGEELEMVEAGG